MTSAEYDTVHGTKRRGGLSQTTIALLVVLVVLLVAIAVLVLAAIDYIKVKDHHDSGGLPPVVSVATQPPHPTPTAWQLTNIFTSSMNLSVDPCQDFYQYACGNWIQNHPISPSQSSASSFGILAEQVTQVMATALNSPDGNWPRGLQQAGRAFQKCVNEGDASLNGEYVLHLMEKMGGWPIIQPHLPTLTTEQLAQLMATLSSEHMIHTFITPVVDTNWQHNSRHMLYLSQATLTDDTIFYTTTQTKDSLRKNLGIYMRNTVMTLATLQPNSTVDPAQINQTISDMVDLEFTLAGISVPGSGQRNYTQQYNVQNINSTQYPHLLLKLFLQTVANNRLGGDMSTLQSYAVMFPDNMKAMNDMYPLVTPQLIQNYLIWRFLHQYSSFLPSTRDAYLEYRKAIHHVQALPTRTSLCSNVVVSFMPYASGRIYVDAHFNKLPGKPRQLLAEMISNVLDGFWQSAGNLNWMSSQTKIGARAKIRQLYKNVAYPDWIMDNGNISMWYSNLNITSADNFWTSYQKLTSFSSGLNFGLLNKTTNRHNFLGSPATVNAWYQPELNSITFPAAILNPPFFNALYPSSINYGAMGLVMGHELTHGFDDEGVQWNGNGTLSNWMDASSMTGFKNMAQCVVDEYNGFCHNSKPNCVHGTTTQGENIADNGGIHAAWNAYKKLQAADGPDPPLPGAMSGFTPDQLFFLSFGQVWCRHASLSSIQQQLLIDVHSPAQDRVKGTLMNFPAFGETFKCKSGDPMYPTERCHVWSN